MILQSLARAVRKQNYYAVFLEFIIVIAGVVIGFQINAWNERRAEEAQGREYLVLLADEVRGHADTYERMVRSGDLRLENIDGVIDAIEDPSSVAADPIALPTDFYFSRFRSYFSPSRTVYDGLESSGDIALIRDEAILRRIREHYNFIASWDPIFGAEAIEPNGYQAAIAGHLTADQMEAVYADEPRSTAAFEDFEAEDAMAMARRLAADEHVLKWLPEIHDFHRGVRSHGTWRGEETETLLAEIEKALGRTSKGTTIAAPEPTP